MFQFFYFDIIMMFIWPYFENSTLLPEKYCYMNKYQENLWISYLQLQQMRDRQDFSELDI